MVKTQEFTEDFVPKLTFTDRLEIIKGKRWFQLVFPVSMLVFLVLLFSILTGGDFLKLTVFKGIFNQTLIVGTVATAVSFIYSTGNIDFSVGNVMGLAAVFGGLVYQGTQSMPLAIVVTILSGIGLMMINCVLGVLFKVKSAMVAIVAMSIYNALTIVLVGAEPLMFNISESKELEGGYRYIMFILYFGLCVLLYHKTAIGRKLRFIGGNENCAKQTGISTTKSLFTAFLFAGIGVGIAGTFQIIRTANIAQSIGNGMGMDVMLATVLGGMSIFGGVKSNAYAGFIGAITVTVLNKGLLMMGVDSMLIQGIRGAVFLILVYLNSEYQKTLPSREQF